MKVARTNQRAAIRRRGMVLPLALGAIAILGVLMAVTFFGSMQRERIARTMVQSAHAMTALDFALLTPTSAIHSLGLDTIPIGSAGDDTHFVRTGGAAGTFSVVRLLEHLYMVTGTGNSPSGSGGELTHRGSLLFQLFPPDSSSASIIDSVTGEPVSLPRVYLPLRSRVYHR